MIDKELLQEMIDGGFVSVQKHWKDDLYIYNYSPRAQYDRVWNDVTLQCRGLILTGTGEVHSRPFRKFFNLEEASSIPAESFEVSEKMDGSLGILYWHQGMPRIATRGSFVSDQAKKAEEILYRKYYKTFSLFEKNKTYLFEIIYPENRIVIDYGDQEELVLLAVIDNATGKDLPVPNIGFQIAQRYSGISDIEQLRLLETDNREGFVIRFSGGLRLKLKFAEYVRLHRILTQISSKSIWELLSSGESLELLLDKVPDEFYQWVRKTEGDLKTKFSDIESDSRSVFKELETRKDTALYFQTQKHPKVLFAMLDKKPYAHIIWKMLKPKFEKPFKLEI